MIIREYHGRVLDNSDGMDALWTTYNAVWVLEWNLRAC